MSKNGIQNEQNFWQGFGWIFKPNTTIKRSIYRTFPMVSQSQRRPCQLPRHGNLKWCGEAFGELPCLGAKKTYFFSSKNYRVIFIYTQTKIGPKITIRVLACKLNNTLVYEQHVFNSMFLTTCGAFIIDLH